MNCYGTICEVSSFNLLILCRIIACEFCLINFVHCAILHATSRCLHCSLECESLTDILMLFFGGGGSNSGGQTERRSGGLNAASVYVERVATAATARAHHDQHGPGPGLAR